MSISSTPMAGVMSKKTHVAAGCLIQPCKSAGRLFTMMNVRQFYRTMMEIYFPVAWCGSFLFWDIGFLLYHGIFFLKLRFFQTLFSYILSFSETHFESDLNRSSTHQVWILIVAIFENSSYKAAYIPLSNEMFFPMGRFSITCIAYLV